MNDLRSIRSCCLALDCSRSTVYKLVRQGRLKAVDMLDGKRVTNLQEFIDALPQARVRGMERESGEPITGKPRPRLLVEHK